MKDNVFRIVVVGLLTAILIIIFTRKQAGRYVMFGDTGKGILDTSTGELYFNEVGHFNFIDDVKAIQIERDTKSDSIKRKKKD